MSAFEIDRDLIKTAVSASFERQINAIVEGKDADSEDDDSDEESDDEDDSDDDSDDEDSDEEEETVEESIGQSKLKVTALSGGKKIPIEAGNLKDLQRIASSGQYDAFEAVDSAGTKSFYAVKNNRLVAV